MIRCEKCGKLMDGQDEFITVLDEVYCPDCFMDFIDDQDPCDIAERMGYIVDNAGNADTIPDCYDRTYY